MCNRTFVLLMFFWWYFNVLCDTRQAFAHLDMHEVIDTNNDYSLEQILNTYWYKYVYTVYF